MSQRTIVITGASDGIGAAVARALSQAGERVREGDDQPCQDLGLQVSR